MKRNPLIPFAITAVVGIAIMLVISAVGVNNAKEKASGGDQTEMAPEQIVSQTCASCHGQNLEGGVGPKLKGTDLSADQIATIIQEGRGNMPPQNLSIEEAQKVAEWIAGGAKKGGGEGEEEKEAH
ncbi:cytochrome c550 [Alkalihalobacillus sp. AL-G]|uniref:cytochrome c550 n=1 Tax=Alkalihalobacillus sp. AL-G TaxID=2926399 RepID=UPI002729FAFA|nr:cytochrome c [Alkalihalobacillus sp. AL-G]WLD92106.1 cytochrome c [Alkalihalobacillus sp. AL-G]